MRHLYRIQVIKQLFFGAFHAEKDGRMASFGAELMSVRDAVCETTFNIPKNHVHSMLQLALHLSEGWEERGITSKTLKKQLHQLIHGS